MKSKVNPKEIANVKKLILAQAHIGIEAAVVGDTWKRTAMGINIQRNLKVLAQFYARATGAKIKE